MPKSLDSIIMEDFLFRLHRIEQAAEHLAELRRSQRAEISETEAWQKSSGKNKNGGLNAKGVKSYRASHPGSHLQTAVTTKPSKLKKGSKAAKRRASFCARMKGMKKHRTGAKTKHDPNSRINKSLRKWHCESLEEMRELIQLGEQYIQSLKEFAPSHNGDNDHDHLHHLARMWYKGDDHVQDHVERVLDRMGWGISQVEDGSEAVQLVHHEDINGDDVITFMPDDLEEGAFGNLVRNMVRPAVNTMGRDAEELAAMQAARDSQSRSAMQDLASGAGDGSALRADPEYRRSQRRLRQQQAAQRQQQDRVRAGYGEDDDVYPWLGQKENYATNLHLGFGGERMSNTDILEQELDQIMRHLTEGGVKQILYDLDYTADQAFERLYGRSKDQVRAGFGLARIEPRLAQTAGRAVEYDMTRVPQGWPTPPWDMATVKAYFRLTNKANPEAAAANAWSAGWRGPQKR
jgi:Domain of unknown function (DUF6321)